MNLEILQSIISQPTAPFKEDQVRHHLLSLLKKHKIPSFLDPIGNIVVGAKSKEGVQTLLKKAAKTQHPMRLFVAHMDHPGFHGVEWLSPTLLRAKWYGGSPTQDLIGRPVSVYWNDPKISAAPKTLEIRGHVQAIDGATTSHKPLVGKINELTVELEELATPAQPANSLEFAKLTSSIPAADVFGAFTFSKPYWYEGDLLFTKCADDLAGIYAILQTAIDYFSKKDRMIPFLAIFTRAEEVGWIGCIEHLKLGWIKKRDLSNVLAVSLETSRQLPGAEIGKGVIVRLGDRSSLFSSGATHLLQKLAALVLPQQHQTRIMDGGSCEASATITYGIPTIALSLPLGNYHNQSLEGGTEAGPANSSAPEFVHLKDLAGMLTLCGGLMKKEVVSGEQKLTLDFSAPYANRWKSLDTAAKAYDNLLHGRHAPKKRIRKK